MEVVELTSFPSISTQLNPTQPGDRVQIVGIYRALPSKRGGSTSGVFKCVLLRMVLVVLCAVCVPFVCRFELPCVALVFCSATAMAKPQAACAVPVNVCCPASVHAGRYCSQTQCDSWRRKSRCHR